MIIEQAKSGDFDEILSLYRACGELMRAQGIIQWGQDYPRPSDLMDDIDKGELYVLKVPKIGAVVTINENQDPVYQTVNWLSPENSRNLIVHRLGTHPAYQGQGLASKLMDFCENFAKENGYDSIRLDTYELNPKNLRFYQKRNYQFIGKVDLGMGHQGLFHCLEWFPEKG